jgi:hypothetical protein
MVSSSAVHVLVDAAEGAGLDVEAGLFADLAAQAVLDRLGEFEDATGRLPAAVVAALDEQGMAAAVGDDAADADRVAGLRGVQVEPPIGVEPMTYALRVRRSNRLS